MYQEMHWLQSPQNLKHAEQFPGVYSSHLSVTFYTTIHNTQCDEPHIVHGTDEVIIMFIKYYKTIQQLVLFHFPKSFSLSQGDLFSYIRYL